MMPASEAAKIPRFVIDRRLGNTPRRRLVTEVEELMQIPGQVRNCVAFVYFNPQGSGERKPIGTAFFLGVDGFLYCVTAKHLIDKVEQLSSDRKLLLRMNMRSGGSDIIETNVADWRVHPIDETVDVAALYVDGLAEFAEAAFEHFEASEMLTDGLRMKLNDRLGEEVFLTGMFFHHMGEHRMLPVIRTGVIAAERDPNELVWDDELKAKIDVYLIETRSIGGLSGSPVFFYPGTHRWLRKPDDSPPAFATEQHPAAYWLGLIHGHWRQFAGETANIEMNSGMAMVVPAEKVIEVLKGDDFEKQRAQARIARRNQYGQVALDALPHQESESSEGDFDSALRKVSKREPKREEPSG
jgi:hypothetical protein